MNVVVKYVYYFLLIVCNFDVFILTICVATTVSSLNLFKNIQNYFKEENCQVYSSTFICF